MAAKKKVSVRFIAEQCNVSTATVSRVLNNDDSVTESTRRKVPNVNKIVNTGKCPKPAKRLGHFFAAKIK